MKTARFIIVGVSGHGGGGSGGTCVPAPRDNVSLRDTLGIVCHADAAADVFIDISLAGQEHWV